MRRIAMIPARMASKRVPKKNLRILGDKPLLAWVTETARDSGLFDDVYVNSESDEIGELAQRLGVKFYKRDESLAADSATSEHFVKDFMEHVPSDVLFQITPTSPFIAKDDLRVASNLINGDVDTVLSFEEIHAECKLRDKAINFNPTRPMLPSQELYPVDVMRNGIFAWRTASYTSTYGSGSRVGALYLSGDSALDIDTEEDFALAEAIVERRRNKSLPRYWSPTEHTECAATQVLFNDGVKSVDLQVSKSNIYDLLDSMPQGGARRVVERASNSATIISQMPGEGNRRHYHADWDEWWLILEGEYEYEIEGIHTFAKKGDIISIERGQWHQIRAIGNVRASRLAVSRDGVGHTYSD